MKPTKPPKIEMWPIDRPVPYARNPRKISPQAVSAVAGSIKEFGFKSPIIVDSQGVIINGHTRMQAAQSLGLATVPVLVADDLTPAQVQAYRLADNRVAEFSEWDADLLKIELGDCSLDLGFADFDGLDVLGSSVAEAAMPDLAAGDRDQDSIGTITIRLPLSEREEVASWLDSIKPNDPSGAILLVCRGQHGDG